MMAYSCPCTSGRADYYECPNCSEVYCEDPEIEDFECIDCDEEFYNELKGGSHLFCENRLGGANSPYCIHSCNDGCTQVIIAHEFRSKNRNPEKLIFETHRANIHDRVGYICYPDNDLSTMAVDFNRPAFQNAEQKIPPFYSHCPECNKVSEKGWNWDYEDGQWRDIYCLNCDADLSLENLILPFSKVLICQNQNCKGETFTPAEWWPIEYYCSCCRLPVPMAYVAGETAQFESLTDGVEWRCDFCDIYIGHNGKMGECVNGVTKEKFGCCMAYSEYESEFIKTDFNKTEKSKLSEKVEEYLSNNYKHYKTTARKFIPHIFADRNYTTQCEKDSVGDEIKWSKYKDSLIASMKCNICSENMYAKVDLEYDGFKEPLRDFRKSNLRVPIFDYDKLPTIEQVDENFFKSNFNKADFNKY
jgi:hypothetical protein